MTLGKSDRQIVGKWWEKKMDEAPPFKEGQIVRIKNNDHLGLHRVESCEWFERSAVPYWLCECAEIREPIDWSKIPDGATGIVASSSWRGNASHLIAEPERSQP